MHLGALAVPAALGRKMMFETIIDERRQLLICLQNHIATATPVSPIGPTLGNVGLTPEGHAAGTAVSTFYADMYLVDKHVFIIPQETLWVVVQRV